MQIVGSTILLGVIFTRTHSFSALYVSHWLEHLVLDDLNKVPTYFGRFIWMIGSKFLY